MELKIDMIRKICRPENIEITLHAAKRLEQRGIRLEDIMNCIMGGEIIEQYPTDYPYPSCLVLGVSMNHRFLHTVVGSDQERIWIITAYYPDENKWSSDFRSRKEQ